MVCTLSISFPSSTTTTTFTKSLLPVPVPVPVPVPIHSPPPLSFSFSASSTTTQQSQILSISSSITRKYPTIFSFSSSTSHICRAGGEKYKFPNPIPEFAEAETEKFRAHLLEKLSEDQDDVYEGKCEEIVDVCSTIFSKFLHKEYGGPGTLLVMPFMEMAEILDEKDLPGSAEAAREACALAREHVDKDWKEWTGDDDDDDADDDDDEEEEED